MFWDQSRQKNPGFSIFFSIFFRLFSGFFFDFFPTYLYSKKSYINWLFTYVSMYLIYVEGDPQCGGILFCGKRPQQPRAVCGEGGSHDRSASQVFFDAAD